MSQDPTNEILKIIDPVFQAGYAGEDIDIQRIISALRRVARIALLREVCDWHIMCEKEAWPSQASIVIEYDEGRATLSDSSASSLDFDQTAIAEQLVETIDQYGLSEPRIDAFIDKVLRTENADGWSILGWQERLARLAGDVGLDVGAYYSACIAQQMDTDTTVPDADSAKPAPRM